MPIRYEHAETVRTTPERAFAAIDDLPLTAKWLPPCVSLEKLGDGPNAVGDKLRYVFKQGGRQQEMTGEILEDLKLWSETFPAEAIEAAVAQKEAITPRLLAVLEEVAGNPEVFAESDDYFLHIHAMFLLAQFREKAAFPWVARIASLPAGICEELVGGDSIVTFGRVLASTYGGDAKPIDLLIRNTDASEWARAGGVHALVILGRAGLMPKPEVEARMKALFEGGLELEPSQVWTELALAVGALPAPGLFDDLGSAVEHELVDDEVVDLEGIEDDLREGPGTAHDEVYVDYRLVTDAAAELQEGDDDGEDGDPAGEDELPPMDVPLPPGAVVYNPVTQPPPIGRNDPCPCGSGKKYKKCHGS